MTNSKIALPFLFFIFFLSACGGGGESTSQPQPVQNKPPSVSVGDDITTTELAAVTLSGVASDSDGSIASYSWVQTSGKNVSLSSPDKASTAFTAPQVDANEVLTFKLTVTDDDGATSTDSVNVTVQNGPTLSFTVIDFFETPLIGYTVRASGDKNYETMSSESGKVVLDIPAGKYKFSILLNQVLIYEFNDEVRADRTLANFGATVKLPENAELPHPDTVQVPLPNFFVEPSFPYSNQSFSVFIDAQKFTNGKATFKGPGCGNLAGQTLQPNGKSQIDGVAGISGLCEISYSGLLNGAETALHSQFFIEATEVFSPAVEVEQGDFFYGEALSTPTNSPSSPYITNIAAPNTLINGAIASFELSAQDMQGISNIQRVQFSIAGIDGVFSAPATVTDGKITVNLSLSADFFDTASVTTAKDILASDEKTIANYGVIKDSHKIFDNTNVTQRPSITAPKEFMDTRVGAQDLSDVLKFAFQLVDFEGNVSAPQPVSVNTRQVGSGSLQFSISWDAPTDVDLWVYEPSDEKIYWRNRKSSTNGQLDLDSNAYCRIDNVNNENITWPNTTPPAGEYRVFADHYSSCGNRVSNYVVTINNCGITESYSGTLRGDQTADVARVTFKNCTGLKVSGKVFYEDFKPTGSGLSTTAVSLPVAYADVHVKRQADNVILASGSTDSSGAFSIDFSNEGTPGYYVEVRAEQKLGNENVLVKKSSGEVYTYRSGVYDEKSTPKNTNVRLDITKAKDSGAFNIFDMGVKGAATVRRFTNINPQEVSFVWPGVGNTSYWNGKELHILKSTKDSDEFDDMVVLHEYGHYYQAIYSKVSKGAYLRGCHTSYWAEIPHKAWSEGMATFFAGAVKSSPQYIDTRLNGALLLDIENAQDVPKGVYSKFEIKNACSAGPETRGTITQSQDQEDMLSEGLVSAILWDLYDPANSQEPYDTISNSPGVFKVFDGLSESYLDIINPRNAKGVDIVDFLDIYCKNNTGRGNTKQGVEGILGHHKFPYDFKETCEK